MIPDTYWSFKHALKFISKKAASPPLGLLTVAAMLPESWERKVVDLNVEELHNKAILWADYVFISAMSVQKDSVFQIIERCKKLGKRMVAGGPLFTGEPETFKDVAHLILNEAEITFPLFLEDLKHKRAKKSYSTAAFADMSETPPPDYSLVNVSNYSQVSIQFSRGCPFSCEFCEITALLGHKVRTKSTVQIIHELDNIYSSGYRGSVFFVDDNFIGNRKILKEDLLPQIVTWMRVHKDPFAFTTEASINLSDDAELLALMVRAGFVKVFIGIESPDKDSLVECNKLLNVKRDMMECVQKIHAAGIEVSAGFIVGFDSDTPGIFQRQIDFIQRSGIITAMVGLLNAPNRTKLYHRLFKEGRILKRSDGNNTSMSLNFIPKMDKEVLLDGYQHILSSIYSRKAYYERLMLFLKNYRPRMKVRTGLSFENIKALMRSILIIGVFNKGRIYYWKLFFWSIFRRPELFPLVITYSIYGYHFRKVFGVKN